MDFHRKNLQYQPRHLHKKSKLSPIKPRQKMPTIYRHRRLQHTTQNTESIWPIDNSFLRTRLDSDIEMERSTMLTKVGRPSHDNPQWMTITEDYYRKDHYNSPAKSSYIEQRFFDVFNKSKRMFGGRNQDNYFIKMQNQPITKPRQIDLSTLRKTLQKSYLIHGQVANKVGSSDFRDLSIPRPQLKVGSKSFVDTYSPF